MTSSPTQATFNTYVANGATTVFPFGFLLLEESDLTVSVDGVGKVNEVDFTISGIGDADGGDITFLDDAPENNARVLLVRLLTLKRQTAYQDNGDLLAATINRDFDRIWQALQQLQHNSERSLKLPIGTADDQLLTDDAITRANAILGFDTEGNPVLKKLAELEGMTVSAFIATLLDDATAAKARETLGIAGALSRALSNHNKAPDPHPGYLTAAEGDAKYPTLLTMNRMGIFTHRSHFTQSGTFTVPAEVSRLRVTVAGAGGGGGGAASGNNGTAGTTAKGGNGGDSSFLEAKAFGGKGGRNAKNHQAPHDSISGIQWSTTAGTEHGQATGGSLNITGGGGAGGLGAKEAGALANFVNGTGIFAIGQAGGSGGFSIADIADLQPGTTIPVTIGAGGAGDVYSTMPKAGGQSGANGYVIVEY